MMQLLNANNGLRNFREKMNVKSDWIIKPLNNYRYYLMYHPKLHLAYYYKYTREAYHTGEEGRSESFNREALKNAKRKEFEGFDVFICIVYADGDIWMTKPDSFLIYGYLKEGDKGEDDKDRYVLAWNKKNERGEDLWRRIKNE